MPDRSTTDGHGGAPRESRAAAVRRWLGPYGVSVVVHSAVLAVCGLIWITLPRATPRIGLQTVFVRATDPPVAEATLRPPEELAIDSPPSAEFGGVPLPDQALSVTAPSIDPAATLPGEVAADRPGTMGAAVRQAIQVRSRRAEKYGGSAGSEAAVEASLTWLARHQLEDGGWAFDHTRVGGCDCGRPGTAGGRTGATGLALLTFLGAGYTHADGSHAATVRDGLRFLVTQQNVREDGLGDFLGGDTGNGGIYQHGIATAAVCEALGVNEALLRLTRRRDAPVLIGPDGPTTPEALKAFGDELRQAADRAIAYTLFHQDEGSGGWGYRPNTVGDTSIVGWQVMSLVSAEAEDARIPRDVWRGVSRFLDSTYDAPGYAYSPGGKQRPSLTAVGATCRLFGDRDYSRRRLRQSVELLNQTGPKPDDMYYTYYATQAVFGWGDEAGGEAFWTRWNERCRDALVNSQQLSGHAEGSWNLGGRAEGGRLMDTCLAAMTLEVYYRKLPAYEKLAPR